MIDWLLGSRVAAALAEHPDRTASVLAGVLDAAPCFQNAGYPVSPLPLYARHADAAAWVPVAERYVALLGKIVRLYREEEEIRRWYALSPAAEALIAADRRLDDSVPVCRLDGYLEQGTERLRLLENNADAPAGTLFSPRVNHLVQQVLDGTGGPAPACSPLTFTAETALLDLLGQTLGRAGLSPGDPRVAVLQFAGQANRESHEMARTFRAAGGYAVVADPRELRLDGDRVRFGTERVNVCWNKVNTVGWRTVVEPDPDLVQRWTAALSGGAFVHVNPFGARYVAESKFSLALPQDPRFAALFTAAERQLVDTLLPWARRLAKDAVADDEQTPLRQDVLDRQNEYVIKEPYDIRGDGVTVGRAVRRTTWEEAVGRAMEGGLLAQRYVAPTGYPVLRAGQAPLMVAMPVSFDTFVFGGRVVGFGSKASLNARLNVFQGGQKLAVHVACNAEPER